MKWFNLKKNKCPSCNADFGFFAFQEPGYVVCSKSKCDFRISHKRYTEIVNSQVTKDIENNLTPNTTGREGK